MIVVEDIPAQMCEQCKGQFFDTPTQVALRTLIEHPESATPKRVMEVRVYSLEGRIREAPPPPPEEEEGMDLSEMG